MVQATEEVKHVSPVLKLAEVVRQKVLPDASSNFVATPNQRNLRMLRETNRYARLAKHFVKKVKAIARAADDLMGEAAHVIESPLPREFTMKAGVLRAVTGVFEGMSADGPLAQGATAGSAKGKEPAADATTGHERTSSLPDSLQTDAARSTLERELSAKVYVPINEWLGRQVEARKAFKTCESVRFELDAARRKLAALDAKATRLANAGKAEEDAYMAVKERAQAVQAQVDYFGKQYEDSEDALNKQLHSLIADATVLQDALSAAMEIQSEALAGMAAPNGFVERSFVEAKKPQPDEEPEGGNAPSSSGGQGAGPSSAANGKPTSAYA